MKDEREVLTKEKVKKDLSDDFKSERFACIFSSVCCVFMMTLIAVFLYNMISDAHWNGVNIIMTVICALLALFFSVVLILDIRSMVLTSGIIKRGKYRIVTDKLLNISEDEFIYASFRDFANPGFDLFKYIRRSGTNIEDAFYFSSYGRVPVSKNLSSYSMAGDMFYLVIFEGKQEMVAKVYNSRIYRLEG